MTEQLRNLGPVSAQWLAEVGIHSSTDLRQVGSVAAYALVRRQQSTASLNLLWGLEAAMRDIDWRELTEDDKHNLREQLKSLTE